ncbi:MAG: GNAT family N-acetyltransferase [Propionibacteriaceae bacterium]|jgi:RimJ/RimL family protein N-acetyltransferase|nr:GNAT family N-acetyltransferase [Propionibacteriaceae bacterium]
MTLRHLATTTRDGLPLVLSPFTADDVGRVHELCQDPEVRRWTTVPDPYPRSAAEEFVLRSTPPAWEAVDAGAFDANREGPELTWAIRVPEGELAGLWGSSGLRPLGGGVLEIGYWLGAGARGRGIARAAAALLVETAFAWPLNADEVRWYAALGNLPSARIAQRTGFAYAGVTRNPRCGDAESWSAVIRPGDPIAPRDDWPDLSAGLAESSCEAHCPGGRPMTRPGDQEWVLPTACS